MEEIFTEKQGFNNKATIVLYICLGALLKFLIYADIRQLLYGRLIVARPAPNFVWIISTVFVVSIIILLLTVRLITVITHEGVSFRWTVFQKKPQMISWSDIVSADIYRYGFVAFGIRLSRKRIIHNVAGNTGLRLILKTGRVVIIGTQKVEELKKILLTLKRQAAFTP